jgi:hypothetical protein
MYRKHFGLTRHPFGKEIEPDDLFASAAGKELEARLGHLIEMRGIGLVTGESGSGKTCACRKVVNRLCLPLVGQKLHAYRSEKSFYFSAPLRYVRPTVDQRNAQLGAHQFKVV